MKTGRGPRQLGSIGGRESFAGPTVSAFCRNSFQVGVRPCKRGHVSVASPGYVGKLDRTRAVSAPVHVHN